MKIETPSSDLADLYLCIALKPDKPYLSALWSFNHDSEIPTTVNLWFRVARYETVSNQNIDHYKTVCPDQYHLAVNSSYRWNRKVRKSAPGSWEFQMKQGAVLHTIRLWPHQNISRWRDYKERSCAIIKYISWLCVYRASFLSTHGKHFKWTSVSHMSHFKWWDWLKTRLQQMLQAIIYDYNKHVEECSCAASVNRGFQWWKK